MTTDEKQITELFVTYFRAIDSKRFEPKIVERVFTSEARIVKPNGATLVGHDEILNGDKKSFTRFEFTHHITTDYVIDVNSNSAKVFANLNATHVWAKTNPTLSNKEFRAGGALIAKAEKKNNIWKVSELTNKIVWRLGEGSHEMTNYGLTKAS